MECNAKPYEGTENYCFVSYCHKDEEMVYPIIEQLAWRGCRIWYDDGIAVGSEWPETVAEHLAHAKVCIAFLSEASMNSHNCRSEVNFAVQKKKDLLVVRPRQLAMTPGMEMQLSTYQAVLYDAFFDSDKLCGQLYDSGLLDACQGEPQVQIVHSENTQKNEKKQYELKKHKSTVLVRPAYVSLIRERTKEKIEVKEDIFVIGREKGAFVIADNPALSSEHAELKIFGSVCMVRDLDSTNHTYINNQEIEPQKDVVLKDGDRLRLASESFTVQIKEQAEEQIEEAVQTDKKDEKIYSFTLMRTGEKVVIDKNVFVVGREAEECDFAIADNDTISGRHMQFCINGGEQKVYIQDLDSTNHTYFKYTQLTGEKQEIEDGDEILLSNEVLQFHVEN